MLEERRALCSNEASRGGSHGLEVRLMTEAFEKQQQPFAVRVPIGPSGLPRSLDLSLIDGRIEVVEKLFGVTPQPWPFAGQETLIAAIPIDQTNICGFVAVEQSVLIPRKPGEQVQFRVLGEQLPQQRTTEPRTEPCAQNPNDALLVRHDGSFAETN
jgi:hypothetical protein